MRCVASVAGLSACLLMSVSSPAAAQSSEYTTLTSPESAQNWYLTLGAGLRYQPDYVGSKDYVFNPRAIISLGRGLRSNWWAAEDDAISIGFFSGTAWRVGFSGNLLWQRSAKGPQIALGIPDTKFGGEAGGFLEFYPASWLRARVDLRRGIRTHDALVAEVKVDAFQRIGAWTIGAGPRMSIVGADYIRTYYGPGWAGNGGLLKRYNAGINTVGAIAQATYHWNERFSTTGYVEYKHLVGDAARTPIVRLFGQRDSITVGLSASYSFDTGFSGF